MQVILLERVESLGQMGDVVTVKSGYARNFLLPRQKALRATKENIGKLAPLIKAAEADIAAAKPKPQPTEPVAPPPSPPTRPAETRPSEPVKPALDPRFEPLATRAQNSLEAKRYAEALQHFDDLKAIDANEFAKRNLASKRADAAKGRATELVQEGQTILKDKEARLSDARAKFQESQRVQALPAAQDGLAEIQRREQEYARTRYAADLDRSAGRAAQAAQKYLQAHDLNPEQFKADNLAATVKTLQSQADEQASAERERASARDRAQLYDTLTRRGIDFCQTAKYTDAAAALSDARRLDEARFDADKNLARMSTDITTRLNAAPAVDYSVVPLQDALVEYLKGNVGKTIALLEPAAKADNGSMDKRIRATLHAYLGAAYADRSLVARTDDERQRLKLQAMNEFTIALQAAPDYQLSESVVSPSIRAWMQEARGKAKGPRP